MDILHILGVLRVEAFVAARVDLIMLSLGLRPHSSLVVLYAAASLLMLVGRRPEFFKALIFLAILCHFAHFILLAAHFVLYLELSFHRLALLLRVLALQSLTLRSFVFFCFFKNSFLS